MYKASILALTLILAGCAASASRQASQPSPSAASQLHALIAKAWAESGKGEPPAGASDYQTLWGDPSLAHVRERVAQAQANLATLQRIDFEALAPDDRLSYRLFKYQLEDYLAGAAFAGQTQTLMTQLWGPQLQGNQIKRARFDKAEGYRQLLNKLKALGPYLAAVTARLRHGMTQGVTQPRVVMQRVSAEIEANITDKASDSPFYTPFRHLPETMSADAKAKLQRQARAAIDEVVNPAYRQFLAFFENDYLARAREPIGVSSLADGEDYYAWLVRHYTTTDMTPSEVHALGLKLVTRIHGQMQALFEEIGFEGSYQDFLHYLRTDPKFHYSDADELLKAYRAATKRIDPHMVEVLGTWLLPRVPYGVHPIPASLAPNTYPAYSEPPARDGSEAGYVGVNLYKPETRPKYAIQVLMCHEGRPGHQLQIPVANQLANLPKFRRFAYYNAFGEGWALYAETLCDEPMGLYDDAYSKFGYLNYQMWRAVRLVVDTGIHAKGWSREQALEYMHDNTALAEQNIATEVDRYIVWPGQALSYMIGEQTILKLRARAKAKLGEQYSLEAFNNVVLGQGSLPMAVLADVVDRWIDNTLAGTPIDQLPFACQPRSVAACPRATAAPTHANEQADR